MVFTKFFPDVFDIVWLVVWNICYLSHHIGNVIIPTDELTPSFFRGVGLNHQPVNLHILDLGFDGFLIRQILDRTNPSPIYIYIHFFCCIPILRAHKKYKYIKDIISILLLLYAYIYIYVTCMYMISSPNLLLSTRVSGLFFVRKDWI